jgi:transposase-like protein
MTREEKRDVAERLSEKGITDDEIAGALDVPRSTVNYWTKDYHKRIKRTKKELVYDYADKHPKKKLVEVRKMILEEHGLRVPHSSHSDWLRDREKTEAAWSEESGLAPGGTATEDMTYAEYAEGIGAVDTPSTATGKSSTTIEERPTPAAPLPEYICDGYKPNQEGVSEKEFLQTGCLKCKSLQTTGTVGWTIELECRKGHQMCVTGLTRDR